MQESDRSMLVEYWLSKLLMQGLRPLCYARTGSEQVRALVAFLLPIDETLVGDAECEISLDPGPPCNIVFSFYQGEEAHRVELVVNGDSGCQAEDLLAAAREVSQFWLFINQADYQGLSLYEVEWNPSS